MVSGSEWCGVREEGQERRVMRFSGWVRVCIEFWGHLKMCRILMNFESGPEWSDGGVVRQEFDGYSKENPENLRKY